MQEHLRQPAFITQTRFNKIKDQASQTDSHLLRKQYELSDHINACLDSMEQVVKQHTLRKTVDRHLSTGQEESSRVEKAV